MNIVFILIFLIILFVAFIVIKKNKKLKNPRGINKLLNNPLHKNIHINSNKNVFFSIEKSNNADGFSSNNEDVKKVVELIIDEQFDNDESIEEPINDDEESIPELINLELLPNVDKVHYQHYYIVKEIEQDKLTNSTVSAKEYVFASSNLHKSREEARLLYDNKISIHPKNDNNTKFMFELYLVNNVFFDAKETLSGTSNSSNNIKSYLLIDNKGKIHQDGRNFEYFVLSKAAKKMNEANEIFQSSIKTKNSFLDGNYKD